MRHVRDVIRLKSAGMPTREMSVLRRMQACSWKVCSAMSSARPVGCERRRLAILAHGGSAILGRGDWDAAALRDIVHDYVIEHLADDDAVLVIDETGFSNRAKRVTRSGAAIHWFGREDHELPDRRLRCLRFASWSCVHRSRVVSSEGMDRRSRSPGSRICACRCRLCDQPEACDENDRTRDSCGFRFIPAGYSDLKPATVPI
jgi:hypothetical protein